MRSLEKKSRLADLLQVEHCRDKPRVQAVNDRPYRTIDDLIQINLAYDVVARMKGSDWPPAGS